MKLHNKTKTWILILSAGLLASCSQLTSSPGSDGIKIEATHFSIMKDGAATSVGQMMIHNNSSQDDALIGVKAKGYRIEIHKYKFERGMTRMKSIKRIKIPAGGNVTLSNKGYHLLIIEPAKPLKAGEKVKLELSFKKAGIIATTVKVSSTPSGRSRKNQGAIHAH